MKLSKILLVAIALFAFACSDDDDKDVKPVKERKSLSLTENDKVVAAPTALLNSNDPQAQMAAGWINQVNTMGTYLQYFDVPPGATKSSSKITASNSGQGNDNGDYEVYTWHDQQSGYSVAFQYSETSYGYAFEIFMKEQGQDWLEYLHAEEKDDQSEGFMEIYDIFGDDPELLALGYEWRHENDIFSLYMEADGLEIELSVNEKTTEGDVAYYIDGIAQYELDWDSAGNGTWAYYDEEGNVVEEGEWEV